MWRVVVEVAIFLMGPFKKMWRQANESDELSSPDVLVSSLWLACEFVCFAFEVVWLHQTALYIRSMHLHSHLYSKVKGRKRSL